MSESSNPRWKKVEALFAEALELAPAERAAFLERECGGDTDLLNEVRELLDADAGDDPIDAIVSDAAEKSVTDGTDSLLGKSLGNYRLLEVLGEGGMGTVYLAERADDQFSQQVAIKLLNAYRPSKNLVQRLRAERQILANLNHKSIASLLDGGETEEGLPFLAMEYIDGQPIDQYCDANRLSVAERLRLFCKVCDAVDHAHRNLIVHRDLKPGNILIDQHGEPKLLDFGIAKILDSEALAHTMAITRQGALLLTPQFASPEQVRGEPPAIATDVYSLGVLLYRLLTGYSPYGKSTESPIELEKAIIETDPPKPSTIVVTPSADGRTGSSASAPSEERSTSPDRLRKRLQGDLDNIVLKTLQKDPERRYATAKMLQQDIENYLNNRPVLARPDSLTYRLGKAIRRNRLEVATGAVSLLAIIGLVTFYTWQLTEERDRARMEANRAEQVAAFLTDLFEEASPQNNFGEPMNARQLLDTGAARISDELDEQPELKAALGATIGESYTRMRENKTAREFLEPLVADMEARLGIENETVLRLRMWYGNALLYVGEIEQAKSIHSKNYETWLRIAGPDHFQTNMALQRVAVVETYLGNNAEAEPLFVRVIDAFRRLGDEAAFDLAETLMEYGVTLRNLGRPEEEESLLFEALALQERISGPESAGYASVINNLGTSHYHRGNLEQAARYLHQHLELQRKLVGEQGVAYANALMNEYLIVHDQGRYEEALDILDEAIVIYRTGYGEDSVPYAYMSENRGNVLMTLERYDESDAAFRIALDVIGEAFGTDHTEYAFTQANYGNMLERAGRVDEGIQHMLAALDINLQAYGEVHLQPLLVRLRLSNAYRKKGDLDAALEQASIALSSSRQIWDGPHPSYVNTVAMTAHAHRERKEFAEAERLYREAMEMASQLEGGALRQVILLETDYARSLIAEGRHDEALALLEPRATETESYDASWERVREDIAEILATIPAD